MHRDETKKHRPVLSSLPTSQILCQVANVKLYCARGPCFVRLHPPTPSTYYFSPHLLTRKIDTPVEVGTGILATKNSDFRTDIFANLRYLPAHVVCVSTLS